jgi:hypothetical protein
MKTKMILTWVMGTVLVIGIYGPAIAGGGGPEDPGGCTGDLPAADSGRFIRGEFISAGSYLDTATGQKIIPVAISLQKGDASHLFSFMASFTDVCTVTAAELVERFKWIPCRLGVAGAFGLSGIPVITNLDIIQTDQCGTFNAMVRGEMIIRVVPLPKKTTR